MTAAQERDESADSKEKGAAALVAMRMSDNDGE